VSDGNSYTAAQAAQVLGRSVKRVRQMIQEGKLDQLLDREPVEVTAQSVHELRDALKSQGPRPGRVPASTGWTYEQVKDMVDTMTTRALEMSQAERASLMRERDNTEKALRDELDQTRAQVTQLRAQLEQVPTQAPEAPGIRRRWWNK
jgi:hypothetical protein